MTTTTNLPPSIHDASATAMDSWVVNALGSGYYVGYCEVSDVQNLVQELGNTPKSFDDFNVVARAISSQALELQSIINPVLAMPYTGSDAQILGRLNVINAYLAAAAVWERAMTGVAPGESTTATDLRNYAFQQLTSIVHGEERWESPFGDATARADQPAYTKAQLAMASTDGALRPTFGWDYTCTTKPNM